MMEGAEGGYRASFDSLESAQTYEVDLFGAGTYGSLLWEVEKRWLLEEISEVATPTLSVRYLDFATGTGRVLGALGPYVGDATGVDISDHMLAIARAKFPDRKFVQGDVTQAEVVTGTYDLVTAFRFLLNAEPDLRVAVLRRLAGLLSGPSACLILNVHAHVPSHKSARRMLRRWQQPREGHSDTYLTDGEVRELLGRAGLAVRTWYSYDFLSGFALRVLSPRTVVRIDNVLSRTPGLARFGGHRIYVAGFQNGRASSPV